MHYKTKGIVLQTIKYSETSVIAKIFTEQLGLVSYMVNGVRSIKSSSKASMLQPLTLLDLEVTHRESKNLQRIKEFRRSHNYQSLPFDILKSTMAVFLLEVVTKSMKEHDANEELFQFVWDNLCFLDDVTETNNDFHLQFLLHYAGYLGFAPYGTFSDTTPYFDMQEGTFTAKDSASSLILSKENSHIIYELLAVSTFENANLKLNRGKRKEVLHHILKYFSLHLEGFNSLRSPDILEEVFG